MKCKVTVVVLQRQLFWQQFLSCHERLQEIVAREAKECEALVSTHPPPTRSRDSRHTDSPRGSWSTSLARSSRSPPWQNINMSTCQHIRSTCQHIRSTPTPGHTWPGRPMAARTSGRSGPAPRGRRAGTSSAWPAQTGRGWLHFKLGILARVDTCKLHYEPNYYTGS